LFCQEYFIAVYFRDETLKPSSITKPHPPPYHANTKEAVVRRSEAQASISQHITTATITKRNKWVLYDFTQRSSSIQQLQIRLVQALVLSNRSG